MKSRIAVCEFDAELDMINILLDVIREFAQFVSHKLLVCRHYVLGRTAPMQRPGLKWKVFSGVVFS